METTFIDRHGHPHELLLTVDEQTGFAWVPLSLVVGNTETLRWITDDPDLRPRAHPVLGVNSYAVPRWKWHPVMDHSVRRGTGIPAAACEKCGDALTVVTEDTAGRFWSRCPRYGRVLAHAT